MFTNQHKPSVEKRLSQVSLGYPQQHENLVMFPLVGSRTRALEYKLLDEALANDFIKITEDGSQDLIEFNVAEADVDFIVNNTNDEVLRFPSPAAYQISK